MEVHLSKQAKKQLKALQRSDQGSYKYYWRVIKQLEQLPSMPDATISGGLSIMKLRSGRDDYRIKNGKHRLLFHDHGSNRVEVYALGKRREDSYG